MVKILLMAGHALGINRGFVTVNGRKNNEGDNNIRIEQKLAKYIKDNYTGVKVDTFMNSRDKRKDYSLSTRSGAGNGYDLYLSIHSNSFNKKADGTELYLSYQSLGKTKFAERLNKSVVDSLGTYNRGVKCMDYYGGGSWERPSQGNKNKINYLAELRGNKAKTAMLIELFFHDNTDDVKKFYKNENKMIKAMGDTIAKEYKLSKRVKDKTYPNVPFYAKVTNKVLNIRSGAGIKNEKIGQLKKGDVYTITEVKNNWGKLKFNMGWISLGKDYVEIMNSIGLQKEVKTLKKGDKIKLNGKEWVVKEDTKLERVK